MFGLPELRSALITRRETYFQIVKYLLMDDDIRFSHYLYNQHAQRALVDHVFINTQTQTFRFSSYSLTQSLISLTNLRATPIFTPCPMKKLGS